MAQREFFEFDIDGTFFRESLLLKLIDRLVEVGVFPGWVKQEFEIEYNGWMSRKAGYNHFIDAVVETYRHHVKGVSQKVVQAAARHAVQECYGMVYAYTRTKLETARAEGKFLLALSHSPKEVVVEFCRMWNIDYCAGTEYLVDENGCYTGEARTYNKAEKLQEVVTAYDLTYSNSIGMGDTSADIPIFEIVETPICFNPPTALAELAEQRGWLWVDERKNKAVLHLRGTYTILDVSPVAGP